MKIITIIFLLINSSIIYAQGLINNGANIVVNSGAYIYIDGDANGGYTNTGAGNINSDGTISLEGDWINNGSTDVYSNIDNTGTTVFTGSTDQEIGGSHKTNFENLTVNKSNKVFLSQNTDISYHLTMTNGIFDLKDKIAALGSTGDIVNETETNRITSTDGSGVVGNNTGTITSTKTVNNVSNYDPANLGIKITTNQNLGTITIIRGHQIQTGSYGGTATSGVARYYEVPGIGKLDVAAGIKVDMEYWDAELNGLTESQIEGFHWVTEGSSSSWWTPLDGSVNTSSNLFTTAGNPYGSYFTTSTWYGFTWSDKFTLGSKDTPLPIELKEFTAHCQDGGKLITWTTASEINNDYFILEKSTDGKYFYSIANISGAGTSNEINNYEYYDADLLNKNVYYRLSQTDFNGNSKTFNIISSDCSSGLLSKEDNFTIINNPAYDNVKLQLTGTKGNNYYLSFINQIGQSLITKHIVLENTEQKIIVNTQNLSAGIYSIVFRSDNNIITKQIIINK